MNNNKKQINTQTTITINKPELVEELLFESFHYHRDVTFECTKKKTKMFVSVIGAMRGKSGMAIFPSLFLGVSRQILDVCVSS